MATAPPPTTRPRQARRDPTPPSPRWSHWLLLGLICGLGYGITQRLLEVRWGEDSPKAPAFKEKSAPTGTTLEEMREQQGEKPKPLPADLEQVGRQQREDKDKEQDAERDETDKQDSEKPTQPERSEPEPPPMERNPPPRGPDQAPTLVPTPQLAPPLLPPPPLPPQQTSPPASPSPIEAPPPLP